MKERAWFSFILALLAALACLFLGLEGQSLNAAVILALALACLLTAKLLIELLKAPDWIAGVCALACVVGAYLYCADGFLPLLAVVMVDFLVRRVDVRYALALSVVIATLLALVLPQSPEALIVAASGLVVAFAGVLLTQTLARSRAELANKNERIAALEAQLERQRSTIGTIEQQGRQAERNRLAARIHDKVGHGMTGSILLLEAARLQWKTDPQTADANIEKATENLRETVDEIRRELREERSLDNKATLLSIAAELDEFSQEHPAIATELVTEGNLDRVPQALWYCIYESLLETLTNMLKHSNGKQFRVYISQNNRLVFVEFSDNGDSGQADETTDVARGIGLANIEERVLMSGGKAFFARTPRGFITKLTFTLKGHT
jgi:signal transduction histidine kinase